MVVQKYGYTARITRMWEFLCDIIYSPHFEILDTTTVDPMFDSYLVDRFVEWNEGKDIDFSEIKDKIFEYGDFTVVEKQKLEDKIEYKLWGIFLAVSNPGRLLTT